MKCDKTIQPAAMFTASIIFIYIQLLYYCRYVVTIDYLSHCLGVEYIWKFKSKWSSYCDIVCEKKHYFSKELVFFICHILLYPQKNSFSKKTPKPQRKCFCISHTLGQFWNSISWQTIWIFDILASTL